MSWMYLHFPDLIQQDWISESDALSAVSHPTQDRLMFVSDKASELGVEVDMTVGMATHLCHDIHIIPFNKQRYQQAFLQRALWAYQFSDQVCLDDQSEHPNRHGIWLNMDGMLRLFKGIHGYCSRIKEACQQQQWPVLMAAAHTPLAARHLALNPIPWHATNVTDEASLKIYAQQRLKSLPIDELDLEESIYQITQRLGLKRLQDLLVLPMAEIQHRIDASLTLYLKRLQGDVLHPLVRVEAPEIYQYNTHFIYEIEHQQGLLFPLQRLLGGLCGFLHHKQLATKEIKLFLKHRNREDSTWIIAISHSEHRLANWLDICRYHLERYRLPAPVTELMLVVDQLSPQNNHQLTCFDDTLDIQETSSDINCGDTISSHESLIEKRKKTKNKNKSKRLKPNAEKSDIDGNLVNRLQAKMGSQQIQRLIATADPRPEHAQQCLSLDEDIPLDASDTIRNHQRPLWLLPTPQPSEAPQEVLSGPERIDAGWWENNPVRRDYYVVRRQHHIQWMFRNDQGDWFIQGYFA